LKNREGYVPLVMFLELFFCLSNVNEGQIKASIRSTK